MSELQKTVVNGKLRVVDVSMGWAGPSLGMMLGEMGAEVLKVEDTLHFDWWRGSLSVGPAEMQVHERSSLFNSVNREKLGITLDLASPRGLEIVTRMIDTADVLVENFSPGVIDKLGLSWPTLSARNSRLVMISMPSFGLEGPEHKARGYGGTVEAMAGVTSITGYHDSQEPYMLSNALGDPVGGLNGLFAVLVALHEREQTGRGQRIELAQVEAAIPLVAESIMEYQLTGKIPGVRGNRHPVHAPHGIYRTAGEQGFIAIAAESDAHWRAIADALGAGKLARDPRFTTEADRKRNEDALDAELSAILKNQEADEVARKLLALGVPATQVKSAADVLGDDQLASRGFFVAVDRAVIGMHLYPGTGVRLPATPLIADRPAPLLGEHNRKVLHDLLGMSNREIEELAGDGVIGTRPRT